MTRICGLRVGSLKDLTMTLSPAETLSETPESLPTSEPANAQVSYTFSSVVHLPQCSFKPAAYANVCMVYASGKFATAGTLSWKTKKNGASVSTGTKAVGANNYYTVSAWFLGVVDGDVLEISLWSDQSDGNWDYKALCDYLIKVNFFQKNKAYRDIFILSEPAPVLSQGNPWGDNVLYSVNINVEGLSTWCSFSGPQSFTFLARDGTNGLYSFTMLDTGSSGSDARTSDTYHPYYRCGYLPIRIKARGVFNY
jgi:hypothetical protein